MDGGRQDKLPRVSIRSILKAHWHPWGKPLAGPGGASAELPSQGGSSTLIMYRTRPGPVYLATGWAREPLPGHVSRGRNRSRGNDMSRHAYMQD